jgi:hypothetical protein
MMQQLTLIPYEATSDLKMGSQIEIDLKDIVLTSRAYKDNQTTFAIFNRVFDKVIIKNTEQISYEQLSISFFGCLIKQIEIEEIASNNISVGFYGCLVGGKIRSEVLSGVELVNSFAYSSLFILQVERVRINYSKDKFNFLRWMELLGAIGMNDWKGFIGKKQSFYLNDVRQINFTSSLVYRGIKSKLDLHLSITYSNNGDDTGTEIDNAYLRSLSLTGKPHGKISIDNLKVENVYISDFSPKEEVSFFNMETVKEKKGETKISIHKCDLSTVWFNNVNFDQFDRISFYRSKFSKTIFMSCSFPNDYNRFKTFSQNENIHYPESKGPNPAKDNYEMFLQLKSALEGTGNYYEGQKIQAMAHAALREISNIPFGDRFILWLNNSSNKHALSIGRPLLLFGACTIILYIAYLITIHEFCLSTSPDWKLIGFYFSFIDITHRNDFLIKKEDLTFGAQLIDYFNKLVMSYLLFQFISSFRKYSKK